MRLGTDADGLDVLAHTLHTSADAITAALTDLVWWTAATTWWGPSRLRVARDLEGARGTAAVLAARMRALGDRARQEAADQRRVSETAAFAPGLTTMLLSDDRGDGRLVAAVGDLRTATHVVVLVPGMGSTASNFDGLLRTARRLRHAAAVELGGRGSVAVIAWLGYDAPAGFDDPRHLGEVLDRDAADAGAAALRTFLAGLTLRPGAEVTVIGHSYGSLVAAGAARSNPAVDHLVVIGSPGVGVDRATDLGLAPGTTIAAAAIPGDVVARSGWFGTPPTDPAFGATVLEAHPWPADESPSTLHAHSAYFDEGSQMLDNLVGVVTGRGPRFEFSGTR